MKQIQMKTGEVILVDDEDYDSLITHRWHISKGYAWTRKYGKNPSRTPMHRILMSPPQGFVVDHINGNPLDNRKTNLRICTEAENNRNVSIQSRSTSGLKGVSWYSAGNKWKAQIKVNGKRIHIGYFTNKEEAYEAYCKKGRELHGEFFHE